MGLLQWSVARLGSGSIWVNAGWDYSRSVGLIAQGFFLNPLPVDVSKLHAESQAPRQYPHRAQRCDQCRSRLKEASAADARRSVRWAEADPIRPL
jgi:hypothetical protein